MDSKATNHFRQVLPHLYINPLEKCNLRCKICYTKKTDSILSENEILDFVEKYEKAQKLESVTFCGGEVFTLKYFPGLINKLTQKKIFIQIITNGTIDKLSEIKNPNMVNLIVSVDGLEDYHDKNRGVGNYKKSIEFLLKAQDLGFHIEIFSIVTRQNYTQIDSFEKELFRLFKKNIPVTYHPRKPKEYLNTHPLSNITGEVDGFDFLEKEEFINLLKTKKTFPPKNLGCFQISLMSDGKIYGCCEGVRPLGNMEDDIKILFENLHKRLTNNCPGCAEPDFVCGIKNII
jgi:MoaA/NifB/PqqE/SkfB family radical SAM enzyme